MQARSQTIFRCFKMKFMNIDLQNSIRRWNFLCLQNCLEKSLTVQIESGSEQMRMGEND